MYCGCFFTDFSLQLNIGTAQNHYWKTMILYISFELKYSFLTRFMENKYCVLYKY